MATFNSDIYTTQSAATGDNRADGRLLSGKLRVANATVTLAGTEAGSDVINLVELPTGCLIDASRSFVQAENPGDALVVDIGFASDVDALSPTPLTLSAGGKVAFDEAGASALVSVASGDELIFATVNTATSLTAAQVIRVSIAYVDYN